MDIFEAISNETRRRVLQSLQTPKTFSELSEELKIDSPALSFHIKKLDGLITKDEEGKYSLTELGKTALEIINQVNSGETSFKLNPPNLPLILEYINYVKIDNNLLIKLKEEDRKLIIKNVETVEFDEVNSSLLNEILEKIENIRNIIASENILLIINNKSVNVENIIEKENKEDNKEEEPSIPSSSKSFFSFLKHPKFYQNKIVYNNKIEFKDKMKIELNGGVIKIKKGNPYLIAKCRDYSDLDIYPDKIEGNGCELLITYPDVNSLDIELDGGKISINGIKINNLNLDIDGGLAEFEIINQNSNITVNGGKIDGKITYMSDKNTLNLNLDGGMANLGIFTPKDMSIISSSSSSVGIVNLPPSRPGNKSLLQISAKADGGIIKIKQSDIS